MEIKLLNKDEVKFCQYKSPGLIFCCQTNVAHGYKGVGVGRESITYQFLTGARNLYSDEEQIFSLI